MAEGNFESELFLEVVRTILLYFFEDKLTWNVSQDSCYSGNNISEEDIRIVYGVLRAVVEDDLEKLKNYLFFGKTVNVNDNNGNTPLHVAVIKNK